MFRMYKRNILFIIIISILMFLFFRNAYLEKIRLTTLYKSGIDNIEKEEYLEAQKDFSELGDYKDSLVQTEIARNLEQQKVKYDSAIEAFNNEDYKNAIELFTEIKDFKDSESYIEKANKLMKQKDANENLYNEAYNYYESNNYILAIQTFSKLNGYKDSVKMLEKCRLELAKLQQATTISAGIRSSVGMIRHGKVYLAGNDEYLWKDKLDSWNDIISISVKGDFVAGLKDNGTVVIAGKIPEYYVSTKTWSDIIAVSTGQQYIIGLKSDGTLVAQGHNGDGQVNIDDWTEIITISTGWRHTVGLDSNGEIHITGYGSEKQLKQIEEHKEDWCNIVAISAGGGSSGNIGTTAYTAALKQDGTVVTTLTGEIAEKVSKWEDIIAISAGDSHIVGLKSDGTVITTQTGNSAEETSNWEQIVAVSAGYGFTLGLKKDGTVVATGYEHQGQTDVESWGCITNYEEEWKSIFNKELRWNRNK